MNLETDSLVPEDYFSSSCGSCGREGTVTRESEVGQLCAPCTTMWEQLSTLAPCSCPALWGRHSLSCTHRIADRAS